MSPRRRHGPFFLVGTARRPGASLVSLALPVPLSLAPSRASPRPALFPSRVRRSGGNRVSFRTRSRLGAPHLAGQHCRLHLPPQLRLIVRPARVPVAPTVRSTHRTTVAVPVRVLHRVTFRSLSLVASSASLTRRSGSIHSLCRGPESFVVCSSLFSHFYARRRFLSHPTHR